MRIGSVATRTVAASAALLAFGGFGWAGPFDTGRYTKKGQDGLVSSIIVSNLSAGKQRLLETTNAIVDFGFCKLQFSGISANEVPASYNQKDFVNPKFVSCSFTNDTCGVGPCKAENVEYFPSKFFKQGADNLCKVVKQGSTESQPYCFAKAKEKLRDADKSVDGVRIRPTE